MYCKKCGKEIDDNANYCPYCGANVNDDINHEQTLDEYQIQRDYEEKYRTSAPSSNDSGSFGWAILGFCIPLVGLILWLVWKDSKPRSAMLAGKGALYSMVINLVLSMLTMCMALV